MINTQFTKYWDLALVSVDRQLVAAASACADRGLIDNAAPVSLHTIRKLLEPVRPVVPSSGARKSQDSGHKIDPNDPLFQATLQWLQEEICDLLPPQSDNAEHKEILRILKLTAGDTESHFGTITEGWDRLVAIKHQLLLPNVAVLARSAWLVSLMADFERSLRDAICIPIECLGRLEPIRKATSQIITEQEIKFEPDSLLRHVKTDSAVAEAISQAMAEGVTKTLGIASCFASQLDIKDFEGDCFKLGFHDELERFGVDSKEIILQLVGLRHVVLHDTNSFGDPSVNQLTLKSNLDLLLKGDVGTFWVIAQFLYSYSIHFTLAVMEVVSGPLIDVPANEKDVARYKAAAELHVGTLVLLKQRLWWLAWSLADYVRVHYEGKDGLMLQLNAAFAQSKIDRPQDWKIRALAIEVEGKAARYRLLKKCILGEWDRISPLIIEAVKTRDMTLAELDSWPALELLRNREEYFEAVRQFGKVKQA
jgi:hypothetical protein